MQALIDRQYSRSAGKRQLDKLAVSELKRLGKEQNLEIKKRMELFSWDNATKT